MKLIKKPIRKSTMIISIVIIIITLLIYMFLIEPRWLKISYKQISSQQIPASFDNVTIAFFSDTHLQKYNNDQIFLDAIDEINKFQPDIVIFGGDLFDHPSNNLVSVEKGIRVSHLLNKIKAPLGKFAVLGNHDLEGLNTREQIEDILTDGGFEIITNKSIRIHNKSSDFIQLIGLDSALLGNPNEIEAYKLIMNTDFSIAVCHTPDVADSIQNHNTDIFLSGHSHGGQVYIPLIGSVYKPPYAINYNRGSYKLNDMLIEVSNGIGTTRSNVRLLSRPEVIYYRLKSIINEETKEEDE